MSRHSIRAGFDAAPLRTSSRRSVRSKMADEVAYSPQHEVIIADDDHYRYDSVRSLLVDFCNRTSSHGIPFFGSSSFWPRQIWIIIFLLCLCFFFLQTYFTLSEYMRFRTVYEMNLVFEPPNFPAATVCNLNAFKNSELREFPDIAHTISIWENALIEKGGAKFAKSDVPAIRRKRQAEYQPVYVRCTCTHVNDKCVPNRNEEANTQICICFEDISTGYIWPCYPTGEWIHKKCRQCSFSNTCEDPDRPNATLPFNKNVSCLCQDVSHSCVVLPHQTVRWWNPNNYTIYPEIPPIDETLENELGFEDANDLGTRTTRIKETITLMAAKLPDNVRENISYTIKELVLRCTFNGKDCNLEKDFQLHQDPEFGNCYTFNFNNSVNLTNTKAGPMYGLRLLLNVHQEDYLPTTEAAGVRLVVHEKTHEPFPDAFGYSAPTGFISSFGLKTKRVRRKPFPHGTCEDDYMPVPYIFGDHYSPEGCSRSCRQVSTIKHCGCGDPRLPMPSELDRPCNPRNRSQLFCLQNFIDLIANDTATDSTCVCKQPCTEFLFETSYSAAAWPSMNFKIGDECAGSAEIFNDSAACTEYYRVNTAFLVIYFEQLIYETLDEVAGYTLVNMFSDFGGNIGLWIGFSVITVFEFAELICEMFYYTFYVVPRRFRKTIAERKEKKKRAGLSIPQLLYKHLPHHSAIPTMKMHHSEKSSELLKTKSDEIAALSNDTSLATLPPDRAEIDDWPP